MDQGVRTEYGRSQAILVSKPVRWKASICASCQGDIYLAVYLAEGRTRTEHQCSAKATEHSINACR